MLVGAYGSWGGMKCMQWENFQERGNLEDLGVGAKAV